MLPDSNTHLNLNEYRQLQLPHADHPEEGHTDVVYAVHLQGDHLVSASADQTARVWDLRTQRSLHPALTGHTGSVTAVRFDAAAHEDVIITGDTTGNVMVWQFSTGKAVKTLAEAHDDTVPALQFDRRYLVTGGRDANIKLWTRHSLDADDADVPSFAVKPAGGERYHEYSLLAALDGHHGPVNALDLRDSVLVSGSGKSSICIWSLETGTILHKVNNGSGVACLRYNGRFVVSGSTDNSAKIHDVDRKVEVACLKGHNNLIRSVQVVSDDCADVKTIITGSYDGSVRVWEQIPNAREWRIRHQFRIGGFQEQEDGRRHSATDRLSDRIFSVGLDADRFVCSSQGPIIRVWDFHSPSK